MRTYFFVIAVLMSFLCHQLKASDIPTRTIDELYNQMYDLEGKVVQINIKDAFNAHQSSRETYSFNVGMTGEHIAVVNVPSEIGKRWFSSTGSFSTARPNYIYVKVSTGTLQNNTYGGTQQGLILIGLGTTIDNGAVLW